MLTKQARLAVAQLVIYSPTLLVACWLAYRDGWKKIQWLYLSTLATIRIIGSILSIKASSSSDASFITTAAILNGVGLSPLVLAMLGFVQELCVVVDKRSLAKRLHWLHLPIMVALPLLIVGVLKLYGEGNASQKSTGRIIAAIGLAHFVATFLVQSTVSIYATAKLQKPVCRPHKLRFAVVNSMVPLILVRLTYVILSFFVTSTNVFSSTGNFTVQVVMSILPENLVAVLGLSLGFAWTGLPQLEHQPEQYHHRLASLNSSRNDNDKQTARECIGLLNRGDL